jgi:hypothetical protein
MAKTVGPKTVSGSATVIGSGGSLDTTSACASTTDSYADICPSDHCECFTLTGAKVSDKLYGTGTADVTATIDPGDALLPSALPASYLPTFGEIVVTKTGKTAATETIHFEGAFCGSASLKGKASAGGGWQIIDSTDT